MAVRVTINLPDDISAALSRRSLDIERQTLEALAVASYRSGVLTEGQVRRLLDLGTRFQVHALLKTHRVPLRYTEDDLEHDLAAHREIVARRGR